MKVTFGFRVAVLHSCSPRENAFDALGRKVELNESDAAIEGFAVMRDQPIPKTKAAQSGCSGSSSAFKWRGLGDNF